eukprot:4191331-Pyramimonas_sp.AAC.1
MGREGTTWSPLGGFRVSLGPARRPESSRDTPREFPGVPGEPGVGARDNLEANPVNSDNWVVSLGARHYVLKARWRVPG